MLSCLRRS